MLATCGLSLISDDSSALGFELTGDDFAEVETTVSFELSYKDVENGSKYTAKLLDSHGNDMVAISGTSSTGTLSGTSSRYFSVEVPSTSGDYRMVVNIVDENDNFVAEVAAPLRAVEPITLKVTLKNNADVARSLLVYFFVNGEKIEDSKQEIEVPANDTLEVTYDYVVKDIGTSTFYLNADIDDNFGVIEGLGPEHSHTFYPAQNSYALIEGIAIFVLVVVGLIAIYIYRKPVKNFGKPKSRR